MDGWISLPLMVWVYLHSIFHVSRNIRHMQIFDGFGRGCGVKGGLSSTTVISVFDGYFFGNFRENASIIIQDMQPVVVFSVICKRMTLNDPDRTE